MSKTRTQILDDIENFMKKHDRPKTQWYAGTAKDGRAQLVDVHRFQAKGDCGMYREAASDADAASIVTMLVRRGAKGDSARRDGRGTGLTSP